MSMDYIEITVRQTIPADCLTGIERWLPASIFKTEERATLWLRDGPRPRTQASCSSRSAYYRSEKAYPPGR